MVTTEAHRDMDTAKAKPKSIKNIEERMEVLSPESLRYKVLDAARGFKSSWIELGQYLYSVNKDKLFKEWGYLTFEAYCAKEVGIRQSTAMKLLKSYFFLEREEPAFVKREVLEDKKPSQIPNLEAVNTLRLAKDGGHLTEKDYQALREDVLENPKEETEAKKIIKKYVLKNTPKKEADPEVSKNAVLKKLLTAMRSFRNDLSMLEAPKKIVGQIDGLIDLLEDYDA